MIVKIFKRSSYENIQNQINQWLEENKDINITNILQTNRNDELVISIWYDKSEIIPELEITTNCQNISYEGILRDLEEKN